MNSRISVTGVVQGVGFRPFVYGLAKRLDLHGWVRNTSGGVEILIEGDKLQVERFMRGLKTEAPPLAKIDTITIQSDLPDTNLPTFNIQHSAFIEGAFQPISPDFAICPECERELFDPSDKRYLYPFINCTHCGPRFTIIKDLPYDRPSTTMADFHLCDSCRKEYEDPLNRRFHAQPVACPECGPLVYLQHSLSHAFNTSNIDMRLHAVLKTRRLLREGKIVAIKGLGGFHLACDAENKKAVDELRRRKGRAGKPFALMAADLSTIKCYCEVNEAERKLLTGKEKPIVLLNKKKNASLPDELAPGMDTLGFMLPYTPLHHLLLNQTDPVLDREPAPPILVMTSGNFNEKPIATENQDAFERLAALADAFLLHDRDIHVRCDDSVVRVESGIWKGKPLAAFHFLRRSRGYSPYPIHLPFDTKPTLAVGGELKNTFCLTREKYAFLSHHIGDMENVEIYESFEHGVEHLGKLFKVKPELIAHDLHPGYFTTKYAESINDIPRIAVQHHHAHIAACMADNHLDNRRVIGLSFDGTGYGTDGRIWGGEVMLASYADFERVAHLEYLPLPGGDSATRHPWRIAVGYAEALGLDIEGLPFLASLDKRAIEIVRKQVQKKLNAPETSSIGRLFDAVSSMVGIRSEVSYEAQAAMELEVRSKAWLAEAKPYPIEVEGGVIRVSELLKHVIEDVRGNKPAGWISACFHQTLAEMVAKVSLQIRDATGIHEVALSGGVWQNQILLDLACTNLSKHNFVIFTHQKTPANDGGLALGQAVVANARMNGG